MGEATEGTLGAGTAARPLSELEACLDHIRAAPRDVGRLELLVRRPAVDRREVLDSGRLDPAHGLEGDDWLARGSSSTPDRSARLDAQVTLMNARCAAAVAGARENWPLAGDQFFVDFDLSHANAPAGTRLAIGDAVVEVSAYPHTGCAKFAARFGKDALRFVNTGEGRALNLRGVNARVVVAGAVRVGDAVTRL